MEDQLFNAFISLLPAIIVGGVAFYFLRTYTLQEDRKQRFAILKENQKKALPLRLQAYERLTLFLERISLVNLLLRVKPTSQSKNSYERLLVQHIEQEYEHNITQQIYVSDECWTAIKTAKNVTIQVIRRSTISDQVNSADKLRESILTDLLDKSASTEKAISILKGEVKQLFR
ncbi:hypothetical protein GCM10009117_11170 [Gangjinia marincola]|uniref:Uncharacterized protein n=1 Tax=Gangjinia marincola TaxID=578463 RepID=A0ABN1MGD0_9FLAO